MDPLAFLKLREQRLIAVIRAPSQEAALGAAEAVAKGRITMIEVTFTVPEARRVIAALSERADLTVGAGTVLTDEQARAAIAAGAKFIIAPNVSTDVARVALDAGVLYCPGAYTTNEIIAARAAGAHVVKVYPVGLVGGARYIEIVHEPLPDVPMLAAGGITLENFAAFLRAGAVGVGIGGALADPKLAAAGQFAEITRRAREFLQRLVAADAALAPKGA